MTNKPDVDKNLTEYEKLSNDPESKASMEVHTASMTIMEETLKIVGVDNIDHAVLTELVEGQLDPIAESFSGMADALKTLKAQNEELEDYKKIVKTERLINDNLRKQLAEQTPDVAEIIEGIKAASRELGVSKNTKYLMQAANLLTTLKAQKEELEKGLEAIVTGKLDKPSCVTIASFYLDKAKEIGSK